MQTQPSISQYVPEVSDRFLALFPHRFDYLWAPHPRPGDRPEWRTESRHPLSDRLIQQRTYLYGVRFGALTQYVLLDIDRGSPYHPLTDRFAITNIVAALETIGLCAGLPITSSRSGGIHLYLPFGQSLPSWQIGATVTHLLEQAGFTIEKGLLEVFPNPRNYDPDTTTLYNGHRLPLQDGSMILEVADCRNFVFTTPEIFVHRWQWCMSKNDVQPAAIAKVAKQARQKHARLTQRGSKFLNDLNACIDPGWSDHGQTNFLLGRIALREYVFGHLLRGSGEPLEGDRLVAAIVETATQSPGYRDWCKHQHEIWTRAEDWARCVENSKYFHWATPKPQPIQPDCDLAEVERITWNDWQLQQARDRLRWAIANLLEQGTLPGGTRDRFLLLTREYEFSGQTLYHHRDLWHPDHLWNSPPHPPDSLAEGQPSQPDGGRLPPTAQSLFSTNACNTNSSAAYRQFLASLSQGTGCNTPLDKAFSDLPPIDTGQFTHETTNHPPTAKDTT